MSFLYFKKIFNSIFNTKLKPKVISFMGNHDYHNLKFTNNQNQKIFYNNNQLLSKFTLYYKWL